MKNPAVSRFITAASLAFCFANPANALLITQTSDPNPDLATLLWTPVLINRPFELQSHQVTDS